MSAHYLVPSIVKEPDGSWALVVANRSWLDVHDITLRLAVSGEIVLGVVRGHLESLREDDRTLICQGSGSGSVHLNVLAHAENSSMSSAFDLAV